MKKTIAVLTSCLTLISCTSGILPYTVNYAISHAESQTFGDWEYEIVDGAVNITKYNGDPDYATGFKVELPYEIDGVKVKSISVDTFSNELTHYCELVVPEGSECVFPEGLLNSKLDSISQGDFHYWYRNSGSGGYLHADSWRKIKHNDGSDHIMYDVVMPDDVCGYPVKSFYTSMFEYVGNVRKLTLSDHLTEFTKYSFKNSSITEINIPKGVLFVPDGCFSGCQNLKEVKFHDDIIVVSPLAFEDSSYELPEKYRDENASADTDRGVKTVGDWVLRFKLSKGTITTALSRYLGSDTVLTVPTEVEGIKITESTDSEILRGNEAVTEVLFDEGVDYCPDLTSEFLEKVTLPDTIETIDCFGACPALRSLVLPPSVKKLSLWGVNGCTSLTELIVQSDEFSITGSPLNETALTELELPGNCSLYLSKIPDTLHTIRFRAGDSVSINGASFRDSSLKEMVFSPEIKEVTIDTYAFERASLEKLEIPAGNVTIKKYAFRDNAALKEVAIGGNADIASSTFIGCAALEKVSLKGSSSVEEFAFDDCPELAEVEIDLNDGKSGRCFNNCPKLFTLNGIEVVTEDSADIAPEFRDFVMNKCSTVNQVGFIDRYVVNTAKKVVSEVTDDSMNDIQKVKALHDWVCNNTTPDTDEKSGFDPANHVDSTVFLDGVAICDGYARTFNLLLHEAGIESCFVDNSYHAWNIVKINGKWFHVDTLWDDGDTVNYSWFLKSDEYLRSAGGAHDSWRINCPSYLHSFQPAELPSCDTNVLFGDANLDSRVTVADAVAILQYIGNKDKYPLTDEAKLNADCYNIGDGITGTDALVIQKTDAGLLDITELPYN